MKHLALVTCLALLGTTNCAFKSPPEDYQSANPAMKDPVKPFTPPEAANTVAIEAVVAGSWQGQLPCADCEAINYKLTLRPDKTYEETSEYVGKNSSPFTAKGTWQIASDSVVHLSKNTGQNQFKLKGSQLVMLDQKGRTINSAKAEKYRLRRTSNGDLSAGLEAKRLQGIDFVAKGNGGAWNLDLDLDKVMRFESPGERMKLNSANPAEQMLPDGKGYVYRAKTEAGTMTVRLTRQTCTDKASGRTFPFEVEVTANAQSYTGCGLFLYDNRLNGAWILEQMNGKPINTTDFANVAPGLNLQTATMQASGSSGCNRFTGGGEVKGDKLTFGNMASTRMACPGAAMTFETSYLQLLSGKTYTCTVEGDQLTLQNQGQPVLVYKKAQ
jgi:heat shock protein HslJ/uncharacterized membrane protein